MTEDISELTIESSAFKHNEPIPKKYTCEGEDVSPSLKISNSLTPMVSFAIIVGDPDAPSGDFVHWVAWNIKGDQTTLEEGVSVHAYAHTGTNEKAKVFEIGQSVR